VKKMFECKPTQSPKNKQSLKLIDGSRVAVIGGGPAGSFFSFFLLELAGRTGLNVRVDIYDDKDFSRCGPKSCNHCGGIVSESLVQILAAEGINIPTTVAQRGIDSYVLHTDIGSVEIETLAHEKRIAAMYRGAGPLGSKDVKWGSFDSYLQELAVNKGAHLVKDRVKSINFDAHMPLVKTQGGVSKVYNLLVGAVGVNTLALNLFKELEFGYHPPQTTKTYICEFYLGNEMILKFFGNSMHVFLLNIPRLEFAALIPKGDYVTMVLLGMQINKELVQSFLNAPEVKRCFPPDWTIQQDCPCQCFPKINIKSALKPFADNVVLVGDCATTKLYKNGIGAAYYTAKAAATTAIFKGISNEDFLQHYWPACQAIINDNKIGKVVFAVTTLIKKISLVRRGVIRMVIREQQKKNSKQRMSMVLWDIFTGSADYLDIFIRTLHPFFLAGFLWETTLGFMPFKESGKKIEKKDLESNALGRLYKDGEVIINQGETEDCMYIIQSGKVMITRLNHGKEVKLAELSEGDFFGEMALFEHKIRSATVRSMGESRVLTVDKKTLLHRIQEDPSMAFHIIQTVIGRIRKLNDKISHMEDADHGNLDI
jgi:flavin-dependent dehydrogenase